MANNSTKISNGLNIEPIAGAVPTAEGDVTYDATTHKASIYNGTTASPIVTEAHTATLTNKTYDADGTGNSITNIENADIKAAAAIAVNKLAAITASRAVVSDGSGFVSAATTTSAEIGFVNGVTSAIQTQINNITSGSLALAVAAYGGDPASASVGNPIIFPTKVIDTSSAYSTSTGLFTAPTAGYYEICGFISSANNGISLNIFQNGSSVFEGGRTDAGGEGQYYGLLNCAVNDTISVRPSGTLDANNASTLFIKKIK